MATNHLRLGRLCQLMIVESYRIYAANTFTFLASSKEKYSLVSVELCPLNTIWSLPLDKFVDTDMEVLFSIAIGAS